MIDYEGSVDGVPFDGGKAENSPLELGSHSFIDTFEDQLVGAELNKEVEVNVTFPEDYSSFCSCSAKKSVLPSMRTSWIIQPC